MVPEELSSLPKINKSKNIILKSPTLWFIGGSFLIIGFFTLFLSNYDALKEYNFKTTLEVIVVLCGLTGIFLTFKTLVKSYELNVLLAQQKERHHLENCIFETKK